MSETKDQLIAAAREAATKAYAPYSDYQVGAALLFDDGAIITGTNVENASYGLTVCAEHVAVARAFGEGRRGGLQAVAVVGPAGKGDGAPVTPCGRCRQVLNEIAGVGGTDPVIYCVGDEQVREVTLSQLLPHAFGPAHLE
ncbi:cytidine deaminase [Erythrobacter sp. SCSIO 43205]|uniref:cytidine deaminase n=1 Tax=Erythrobacter sp. SCSIO 43205 TaxID=2779361 RepID=UPI001CA7BE79|nr:cytidine deaminase [Erythrobacter sp. SCSIO 43205]UAB78215.1 cytidine deaminase [Erythrobacter sp. SCSIO 43205]